jgi:hypothetical protein
MDGAAAIVFGFSFLGFFASRFPRCSLFGMSASSVDFRALFADDPFWQSDFLQHLSENKGPVRLESDGALPVARIALAPEVALVATHLDQADPKFVHSLEWMVLARDADGLADLRLGLL